MSSSFREFASAALRKITRGTWSARFMAAIGLVLAAVSALEQGLLYVDVSSNEGWNRWNGWLAFALMLMLLVASAWFAADMQRLNRWSSASANLQARVADIESLHPNILLPTIESVHDRADASRRAESLRDAVAVLSPRYIKNDRPPTLAEIDQLQKAAADILRQTSQNREPMHLQADAADISATWQSIAGLHRAARQARHERLASQSLISATGGKDTNENGDPRTRWTELVTLATILIGLIAAPALADEITGDDNNGQAPQNADLLAVLQDIDGSPDPLAEQDSEARGLELLNETVSSLTEQVGSVASDLKAINQTNPEGLETIRIELTVDPPRSDQAEQEDTDLEPIERGATLWRIATSACDQPDGTTLEIVADVVSIWDANTSRIGADPDSINANSEIIIDCDD
ncbi:MAG: hypothetical protein ACRBK7_12750 [Acidimicrobiales bacterium]